MNEPRRHHLVPKFILKNFTDEHGQLHCFRRDTNEIDSLTPKQALWEEYFYSKEWDDGTRSPDAEHRLSKLETRFARIYPTLKEAARARSAVELSGKKFEIIRRFLRVQFVRSRGVRNLIEQYPAESREKKNAWIDLIFDVPLHPKIEAALASKGLVLQIRGERRKAFIIGDSPICALSFDYQGRRHSEVCMPIASDVAIAMSTTVNHPISRQLNSHQVSILNRDVARHSDTIASHSPVVTKFIRRALAKEAKSG